MPEPRDLSCLGDPVAQSLLASAIPARFSYNWTDGTPRVVPIWFHWDGRQLVFATPARAPKVRALRDGAPVSITIDSNDWPYHVLSMRGTVNIGEAEGVPPEYVEAAKRYLGEQQGEAFVAQLPPEMKMSRIAVSPTWANVLDFETRFPSALSGS